MALGTPLPLLLSTVGDYEIDRSLRFNDDDSAYLNRTLAAGTQTKWTFSCWIKLGNIKNSYHAIFSGFTGSSDQYNMIGLDGSNRVIFATQDEGSGGVMNVISNATLRDPSAWYHIVTTYDSAQSTASDRVKGYINGVQCTSFSTASYPSSSKASYINSNNQHNIGKRWMAAYYDGYIAEVHFCDNQAYTASAFGETNEDTGQWVPKKFAGSYGTNGFKLDFSDNSGTTATTLGKDSSGNSNNFTPNNFSVAAGAGCDSVEDTPTNNFCTFNPLWGRPSYFPELTNGNLDCHLPNGSYYQFAVGTIAVKSGKWYWEVTIEDSGTAGDDTKCTVGVASAWYPYTSGEPVKDWRGYHRDGQKIVGVSGSNTTSAYGASYTDGDVIGVALDLTAGTLVMYKNGTTQGTLDSAMVSSMDIHGWIPLVRGYASPNFNFNFGQRAFAHTPPTGHKKLCTANLPEPTIKKSTDYFNTVLYTGNGTTDQAKTVGFQPDLLWIKKRSPADDHIVSDSVITPPDYHKPNSTDPQASYAEGIKSFDANGFTLGNANNINQNTHTFASWSWKKSASAGFDIIGYTGTGSNPQTRAHSLGVAPEMIIVRNLTGTDGDEHWVVYHHRNQSTTASSANYFGRINTSAAFEDLEMWNDTAPTSSVFTTQNHAVTNANGPTYVAYLWASVEGFSKIGSYVGNGLAEGPFVYTGFKPAWLLVKGGGHWILQHDKVEGYNPTKTAFLTNANNAEEALDAWGTDFLANGFKVRGDGANRNQSGVTFAYMAFASSPFKYSPGG